MQEGGRKAGRRRCELRKFCAGRPGRAAFAQLVSMNSPQMGVFGLAQPLRRGWVSGDREYVNRWSQLTTHYNTSIFE